MARFKPTSLLDKFYEVGIIIKGVDGLLELIGGIVLLSLSSGTIVRITDSLTKSELATDPHNFFAIHIAHAGYSLAHGHNIFAAVFLLIHGFVKVALVTCLLLNKLWAYPVGLVVLTLLFLYQIYQLIVSPGFFLILLTVLDVVIIWLVWREWRLHPMHAKTKPIEP